MAFLSEPNIEPLLNSLCSPELGDDVQGVLSGPILPNGETSSER